MARSRFVSTVVLALIAGSIARSWAGAPCTPPAPAAPADAKVLAPAAPDVLAADTIAFRLNDTTLAHPFFEGRCPGTRGNQLAADLLEFHYKNLKLVPAFTDDLTGAPNGTYRQTFEMGKTSRVLGQSTSWKFGDEAPIPLSAGTDFNALSFSASAEATGPLVFAGYGINIGQDEYTSFPDGTDFKGKIVLLLRYEPMTAEGRSRWGKDAWTYQSQLESKVSAVARLHAAGIVIVNPPGLDMGWVDEQRERLKQGLLPKVESFESLPSVTGAAPVPVVMITTERAEALVKGADPQGRSLLDLRKVVDEKGEVIDLPGATVTLKADIERKPTLTSNVGAILKGRGALASEYVVLGAHYDHVGYGNFGAQPENKGKIHPGADDNASGTSGLMVLAEKLARAYGAAPESEPARSILFLSFTGEESGLNGSRHYTKHMIAGKDKHYLMLNLDMIGRLRETPPLEVSGVGTAEGLEDFMRPYLDSSGLKTVSKPGGDGPSDHESFNQADIPVLFFFTGTHDQYHKPSDTPDTINCEGAAQVIDLAYRVTLGAASRAEPLVYSRELQKKRSTTSDPHAAAANDAPGAVKVTVKFGIMPGNYDEEGAGVLVGGLSAGGWSAEKAGIKKGDRIVRWNGEQVPSVVGWMSMLGKAKPDEKVNVTVLRDGKEMDIVVTLMANDQGGK